MPRPGLGSSFFDAGCWTALILCVVVVVVVVRKNGGGWESN